MSQSVRASLSCPRCGTPFQAVIEQIVDVGADPQAKTRFLSGRLNAATCPNCGATTAVGTPLVYHDPEKQLLLIYVPMELNLPTTERERLIGELTRRVTNSVPAEKRRAYLLQPRQALTLPGMIDTILEADGITAEMREAQREKMRVMEMFLQVTPAEWPAVVEQHAAVLDHEFIQMVLVTAGNAAETGHGPMSEGLLQLYNFLMQSTPAGQTLLHAAQAQEETVRLVAEELQALGEDMTREDFLDLVIESAGDDGRLQALAGLMRPAMDYQFFQELTRRVMAVEGEERDRLTRLRERLLEFTGTIDQQTQAVIQRAADTLRAIATSEDIDAAIRVRLDMIDDAFLAVLQANVRAAEQRGDTQSAERLRQVLGVVMDILRESAPPQIRFINELMTSSNEETARQIIEERAPRFGPELIELMEAIAADLEESGQDDNAGRLRDYSDYAADFVGETSEFPLATDDYSQE